MINEPLRAELVAIAAVSAGEATPRHLAYLTDRVAVNAGQPQTYGTQIANIVDGRAVPQPIHDAADVDRRRAAVGLASLAEHLAEVVARYGGIALSMLFRSWGPSPRLGLLLYGKLDVATPTAQPVITST